MTNSHIIVDGDNYKDALFKGLNILNLTEEQVEVEILEEKTGFLFKKGIFKLKIKPILDNNKTEETLNENETIIKKVEFYLDYNPDGVYLTILETSKISVDQILDFLNKRLVKNYDYGKINQCVEGKNNTAEKIAPFQEELLIDSTLQINICKTKNEASILLSEPIGGKILSTAEIIRILNEKGIVFGINNNKIEETVSMNIYNKEVVVAQGKLPINGDNGQAIYVFDNKLDVPNMIIEEDGSIDYKNLNRICNVTTGTLIMEIIPPTEGINGMDVYGNEVIAKNGSPAIVRKGKNTVESEDGFKIYSSKDGVVYFIDGTIYVDEVINIDGNIDNGTGNIQFNGKVNIKGNVKSGFKVEAEGDIEVFGVVESATLIAKGDIIIHRGVQGNNQAVLNCLGNFKSKYIENASVRSAGTVEADVILHSNIVAKGKITASGKKGLIVGGSIRAGQEVRASILGSNMGTTTKIEVGIDPEEKNYYEQHKTEIKDIEKDIESSKKAIELLNKISKKQKMDKNKQELLVRLMKTYEVLKKKHNALTTELQSLSEEFKESNNGKVHSSIVIYSGVRVIIGSTPKQIYDDLSNCTLYVKDGEVTVGPYEK